MSPSSQSQLVEHRITEWLLRERARREQEADREASTGARRVITLSRQFGAGGHSIGLKVAKELGPDWQLWDREIVDAVAEDAQVRREMAETLDEHTHTWMDEVIRTVMGGQKLQAHEYRRHMATVLLSLAQQGHKIILGRGANFLVPDALNVRLRAAPEFRVKATMERLHVSQAEAQKMMLRIDQDRAQFIRSTFGRDVDEPSAYAMVLQTDLLGFDIAAAVIVTAMRARLAQVPQPAAPRPPEGRSPGT